jgi:hypothetical protein
MEADLQLSVIREFMLAVAPTVVRHSLRSAVFDEVGALPTYTAAQTAKLTLELAMHLAGQYAACYDSLHRETKSARIQVKQKSKTDAAVQPAKD